MSSWEILITKGFTIQKWDFQHVTIFIEKEFPFALDAFKNARNHAEASDIARYLIVYHFGGYYFDWDIELLDPDEFIQLCEQNRSGFLVQDPVNCSLASEAFAACPGESYLKILVENIVTIYLNGYRDSLSTPEYSGPYRMREVYYFLQRNSRQKLLPIKEIFVYDYWEIREKPPYNGRAPMIHYWLHSWH